MKGKFLKLFMVINNLKSYELAKILDITPDRLSKMSNGKIPITDDVILKMHEISTSLAPQINESGDSANAETRQDTVDQNS
jgi:plasmid maintenance system antidote protein VapI